MSDLHIYLMKLPLVAADSKNNGNHLYIKVYIVYPSIPGHSPEQVNHNPGGKR